MASNGILQVPQLSHAASDSTLAAHNEKLQDDIKTSEPEGDYPQGKWRAWSTVLGAWLIQFCTVGTTTSFGVFQDYYRTTYLKGYSSSTISWIGGVQIFLELASGPIGGKLFDAGHTRLASIVGSTLFVFSFFMLSLVQPGQFYQIFLSQGVGMGLGLGILYVPTSAVVSHHFKTNRALAMGIVDSSASLGGIAFSIMQNELIHGSVGFVWGVRASAFVCLAVIIVANCLIFVPPSVHASRAPGQLLDTPYLLTIMWGFFSFLGMYFPSFYVQLFARTHGISTKFAFYSLAILNLASMFGRVLPNYVADRFGTMPVFLPSVTLAGLVQFAMLGSSSIVGLTFFVIFYGFFFGTAMALYLPLIAEFTPVGANMGKRMGIGCVPMGIASLVGPPIAGAIMGKNTIWWKGIVFSAVTTSGSSILLVAAWFIHHNRAKHANEKTITSGETL